MISLSVVMALLLLFVLFAYWALRGLFAVLRLVVGDV
jgi:hypothetical protein